MNKQGNNYKVVKRYSWNNYFTVIETTPSGQVTEYPYFDSEHDAWSFVSRIKLYSME